MSIMAFTDEDQKFLTSFEECSLQKSCWNHRAHIRMAWLQLEKFGSFETALQRIRETIQRYNSTAGTSAYHETITVGYARLIQYRRLLDPTINSWEAFLAKNDDLLEKSLPALEAYYSKDRLASTKARDSFILPDVKPLPAIGRLRMATEDDAAEMLAIYAPYVTDTAVSFEYAPPSEEEFRQRVSEIMAVAPWLVYVVDGKIAGYAYGSKHRTREAYRWSAEVSVYIAPEFKQQAVGRLLYSNLLRLLGEIGYFNAFAGITLPNEASVGLHEAMGFTLIGVYQAVGYKLGRWHDVGWWQKALQPQYSAPAELRNTTFNTKEDFRLGR